MGLFSNPLGYAGYPPAPLKMTGGVQEPGSQNTTVRAATFDEVEEGVRADLYVSPATAQAEIVADFASPPPLGSTTPNTVAATTLTSSGNTTLATAASATTTTILSAIPGAGVGRTFSVINAASGENDTINFMTGANSGNTHLFNVLTGAVSAGTSRIDFFTGVISGGTHTFNLFTNATAGTLAVNIGTCTKNVTIKIGTGSGINVISIGSAASTLGFFGLVTPVVKQTQGAIINNVTVGGTTGTIADFTDLTTYANDSAVIRNDIYQLALGLQGCIAALRNYGLLA